MASSNRHWPSMFKSKPCNPHHPWQHDINPSALMSSGCHRTPYSSVPGCEERTPEPKPRWNPKPEQIRILEAIFNSGMVNPPRDEIRKIRAQLQEYGQVGDANVFYWFQNRKSRSKHKLRHLQNSSKNQQQQPNTPSLVGNTSIATTNVSSLAAAPTSSSSSSEKSSPNLGSKRTTKSTLSLRSPSHNVLDSSNSPTRSVTQNMYLQAQNEFLAEPFFFQPVHQTGGGGGIGVGGASASPQEFCFSDISNLVQVNDNNNSVGPCTSLLLSEIMNPTPKKLANNLDHHHHHLEEKNLMMTNKMQPHHHHQLGNYMSNSTVTQPIVTHTIGLAPPFSSFTPTPTEVHNSVAVTSTINPVHDQGGGDGNQEVGCGGAAVRSTVFINDVAFEVGVGPFNVREAFGDDLLLVHSSGHPVLTDDWGLTLQSLQHGALYYLVPLSMSQHI